MNESLHISFGSITDAGLVKEFNTDAVSEFKILNGHVFIVADGHDGNEGHGALASKLTAESIKKYFYNRSYKDMLKALTNAITYANFTLFEQVQKNEKYNGIGSTLAIVIYRAGKLYYAYAGDSRIYVFRDNELQALTRDHIDDTENTTEAEVSILIGKNKDIRFGVCKKPVDASENDKYLICTDGLTDQLSEDEISEVMCDADKAPEHKCQNLIDMAKEKGGNDCTSVQVLEFTRTHEGEKMKAKLKPALTVLIGIVILMVVSFAAYKGFEALNNAPATKKVEKVIDTKETPSSKVTEKPIIEKQQPAAKKATEKNKSQAIAKPQVKRENIDNKANAGLSNVYHQHKVKYGDNLYRIAIRYSTTQKKLIAINGKKASNLIAGSSIQIPVKAVHKVKKGESFSTISDRYNVKIKQICAASNIVEGTPLKEGQTLIIPLAENK